MLESKTDNDPVRKQKFPANLTKENGNKNLVVLPLLVLFFLLNASVSLHNQLYFNFFEGEMSCHILLI